MFSMMFHRLIRTNIVYCILAIHLFLSLPVNLTSHFSNFADFRQLQIPNARTKYYAILPVPTKTPHNTTHKITSLYFDFKYHFLTLQKKILLLLNKGVHYTSCINKSLSLFYSISCFCTLPINISLVSHSAVRRNICISQFVLMTTSHFCTCILSELPEKTPWIPTHTFVAHYGIVTPSGSTGLGYCYFKWWFAAKKAPATWINGKRTQKHTSWYHLIK